MLSALPARFWIDDKQAYIRKDLGVGGNDLWKNILVAYTLKWPSSLVCLATCIKIKNNNNNDNFHRCVIFCMSWDTPSENTGL